jgi:hypothetical protein
MHTMKEVFINDPKKIIIIEREKNIIVIELHAYDEGGMSGGTKRGH